MQVEIRRNTDGVVAKGHFGFEFNKFWWEEGNASCDCNRELFFMEFLGEDDYEDEGCSEGRYSVKILSDEGVVLLDEWGD